MPRQTLLPFAVPEIGEDELREIEKVILSGWITTGPKTREFEAEFARSLGVQCAVAVNSCTAAMHLALEAAGVKAGDFVITTPYTFAATAEVIRYFDAYPIFVDVDPSYLNIDICALESAIEQLVTGRGLPESVVFDARTVRSRLKAVIPVHIAGNPCDLDAVAGIAEKHGLALIEDAAHAYPGTYKGRSIGSPINLSKGWASCFSFYATKTITTGEGGMVVTDDAEWADRMRMMSLHGISKDAWKRYSADGAWYYEVIAPGFKYNMTDIAAAMGLAQLRRAEQMKQRRIEIARQYNDALRNHIAFQIPSVPPEAEPAWHLYMLRLHLDELSIGRDEFVQELKKRNIGVSVHFIPLHLHPYYRELYGYRPEDFPVASREFLREISLPIYSRMTEQDVQDVIAAVLDTAHRHARRKLYAAAGN